MSSITIINPGLLTTIQDYGRMGYQQYGVPAAGAMDSFSLQLANILVGNDRYEAVLEITLLGPTIEFNSDVALAITGGDISPNINGKDVKMHETICVNKGDILKFSALKNGFRAYLAVAGGFKIPQIMGSKSTYLRGKLGGLDGRQLKSGDTLFIDRDKNFKCFPIRKIPQCLIPHYESEARVRVILGPEEDAFTEKGLESFLTSEYSLTNQCDRMGYRLEGAKIEHKKTADIISGGITIGAIQVPGHGQPIIMMADRQTTGGYTKIANVISVDIPLLAQLKPGDKIKFEKVDIEEAQNLLKEREQALRKLIDEFKKPVKTFSEASSKSRNFSIRVKGKHYDVFVQEIE